MISCDLTISFSLLGTNRHRFELVAGICLGADLPFHQLCPHRVPSIRLSRSNWSINGGVSSRSDYAESLQHTPRWRISGLCAG